MTAAERIVVVGAGLAGLRSAERLRELGFNGELVIIGSEALPPYHRPALSKQLLTGAMRPNDLTLPAYREIGAHWRLGTAASWLMPRNRVVRLPGGEELSYDGLIIATGVEANRPNNVPYHDKRVMVMRTLPDALSLERAIASSRGPVAVVGGGFTGCELAASLRHMGREVTIIGRATSLLGNVLGPKLGDWLTDLHREHGVNLALGTSVQHWRPGSDGIELHLSNGTSMVASCVVIAAGTEPSTGWLRGSGLPLDNGVVCEATCHVVGADDIVAAGDVAQWPNIRFDNVPRRIEHWLNANEMGRAAAESLLAGRGSAAPFTPMPRFWTEQYGVRIQAAGVPKLGTDTITLGTPDEGTGTVVGYVRAGKLMGVVGVDCPSSVLTWTESVCQENPAPQHQDSPTVRRVDPVPAPQEPAVAAASSRSRTGRHSLPAKPKRPRLKDRANQTSSRLSPVDSSSRLTPVGPDDQLGPLGSSTRIRRVPAARGSDPLDSGSSAHLPAVPGPADSYSRLQPVQASGRPGPMDSNTHIPPVPPNAGPYTNGRFGPVDSSTRVPPAQTNGRVSANGGPYTNGRLGPVDSSTRIPPVQTNGRPPVNGGPYTNGRLGPVDSSTRIPPVQTNGRLPVNGRPYTNGRLSPVDSSTRIPPAQTNGHHVPAPANGRPMPTNGQPYTNGHLSPADSSSRIPPVQTNGHHAPAASTGQPHTNGHHGPAGTNGRLSPVDSSGRLPIVQTNRHHAPESPNGQPQTNGHHVAESSNGRSSTNGYHTKAESNGRSSNGHHTKPESNGRSTTNGYHTKPESNGRSHTNGHHGPAGSNGRPALAEVTSWIPRVESGQPAPAEVTGIIPPLGGAGRLIPMKRLGGEW